jgi:CMP-N-acetylneuraminic acid synthetase/quercetin dioxygenase-like cupin family protein
MKIIGMIPVRLGSTRVKNKNLRLINGKPLVQYIIDAALGSSMLDDVYLNSESTDFEGIAVNSGINFYQRPNELSTNDATNDDFALDFIENTECDVLVQLLATSPFISSEEIDEFISSMLDGDFETMISVSNIQIECIYNNMPVNFDQTKQTPPSQLLEPIKSYACSLMGWEVNRFRTNIKKFNAAYHGGDGSIGFSELKGYSTIDIDHEEDFLLAEMVSLAMNQDVRKPEYYVDDNKEISEVDVPSILVKDGVEINDLFDVNNEVVALSNILENMPKDVSWSKRVVDTESNSMTLICQMPGEGNRRHHHPDWNEWWYIVEGEWDWEIEGDIKKIVKGDIVFMEKNRKHKITASGSSRAIRMAVSRADVAHVYEFENN